MKLWTKVKMALGVVVAGVIATLWLLLKREQREKARALTAQRVYYSVGGMTGSGESGLTLKEFDTFVKHERRKVTKELKDAKRAEIVARFHREFSGTTEDVGGKEPRDKTEDD